MDVSWPLVESDKVHSNPPASEMKKREIDGSEGDLLFLGVTSNKNGKGQSSETKREGYQPS